MIFLFKKVKFGKNFNINLNKKIIFFYCLNYGLSFFFFFFGFKNMVTFENIFFSDYI